MNRVSGRTSKSFGHMLRSGLEDAVAVAVVGLVVLGVGGLVYKLLNPDGWLSDWLGKFSGQESRAGLGGWLCWRRRGDLRQARVRRNPRGNSARGNLVVYAFLALGLFFFFKFVSLTGLAVSPARRRAIDSEIPAGEDS